MDKKKDERKATGSLIIFCLLFWEMADLFHRSRERKKNRGGLVHMVLMCTIPNLDQLNLQSVFTHVTKINANLMKQKKLFA